MLFKCVDLTLLFFLSRRFKAGLVRAAATSKKNEVVNYIKPLQCGGSDELFVLRHDKESRSKICCQTLFTWDTPASPHLASRWEDKPVSDSQVLSSLTTSLLEQSNVSGTKSVTIIESAGGALSPSSSSPDNGPSLGNKWTWSTQADLYSSLKIPVVFVGDGKLGGISVTLSTLEALWNRGYSVDAVVFIDHINEAEENTTDESRIRFGEGNTEALKEYILMKNSKEASNDNVHRLEDDDILLLPTVPPMPEPLDNWFDENQSHFLDLHRILNKKWERYFN